MSMSLPKKLRAFLFDASTGATLRNVVVDTEAVFESNGCEKRVFLGTLASDRQGYFSFDLGRLQQENQLPIKLLIYPTGEVDEAQDLLPRLPRNERDPIAIKMSLPATHTQSERVFPSIQDPDVIDWVTSPGSFGAAPPEIHFGEGECEEFVVSRIPTHTYRILETIRDPEVGTAGSLRCTNVFNPCEQDLDFGEFCEPPCVRQGAVIEYELIWQPVGHGLGDVLYTLPLAPCEAVRIAVIDWSRIDQAERVEQGSTNDQLIHNLRRDRVIDETVNAAISEWQRGESTMGGNAGAGSFTFGQGYGFSGNHSFGYGMASTRGDRTIDATSLQQVQDTIAQASRRARQLYSTIVVQASEAESELLQTRIVRNHNRCHAMTITYYGVVRHYRLIARVSRIRNVLLIRPPRSERHFMGQEQRILRNRAVLSRYLLDPGLKSSFDALERLYTTSISEVNPRWILKYVVQITTGGDNSDESGRLVRLIVLLKNGEVRRFELGSNRVPTNDEIGEYSLFRDRQSNTFSISNPIRLDGVIDSLDEIEQVGIHYSRAGSDQWRMTRLTISAAVGRIIPDGRGSGTYTDRALIKLAETSNEYFFEDDGDFWLPASYPADPLEVERRSIMSARANDEVAKRRLINHLETHAHYYNRIVWMAEDPNRRAIEFERYEFERTDGSWRRLIDVIDNRVLDVVGEYVVFPTDEGSLADKLGENVPEPVERIVSLPARGSFAEAKLGHCNGCEPIDDTRLWDAPPCADNAPDITSITPSSRAATGRNFSFAPTLSLAETFGFADIPGAPDPSGLAKILETLGKSDIFRDMSTQEALKDLLIKLAEGAVEVEKARLEAQSSRTGDPGGGSSGIGSDSSDDSSNGRGSEGTHGAASSGSEARTVEAAMSSIERILRRGQNEGSLTQAERQARLREARITAIDRLLNSLRSSEEETDEEEAPETGDSNRESGSTEST